MIARSANPITPEQAYKITTRTDGGTGYTAGSDRPPHTDGRSNVSRLPAIPRRTERRCSMTNAAILEQVRQMTEEQAQKFAVELFQSLSHDDQCALLKLAVALKNDHTRGA